MCRFAESLPVSALVAYNASASLQSPNATPSNTTICVGRRWPQMSYFTPRRFNCIEPRMLFSLGHHGHFLVENPPTHRW